MKQGWESHKFADVFDLQMGKTPSRDNLSYWGGDNVWVSIADLNDKKYISESKEGITDDAVKESGIKVIPKNTVIMSFKLSIGKTAISTIPLFSNEAIMAFIEKDKSKFIPEYIYYYLKGYKWAGANKAVLGMTLNKKTISEQIFSYPSLHEQEKIVAELDCLSGIIEKKKQQLKELDSLAQSIFCEMFGNPIDNEKGWEVKTIGDVCLSKQTIKRANKHFNKEDKIQYIDIASINNSTNIIEGTTPYVFGVAPSRAQQVVNYGDILVSLVRPNLKNIAVIQYMNDSLVASSGFCVLRVGESINEMYLRQVVLSDSFTIYLMNRVSGANYPAVREEDIKRCKIGIPPLFLQQEFASKIEAIEKQKKLIKQSIAETEMLFNSRMEVYFRE